MVKPNLPLSLYIHIPWCKAKCPYCDFNSHAYKHEPNYADYVTHLLQDLKNDLPLTDHRPISSIFIGGGTPSLFSAELIAELLNGIAKHIQLTTDAEITLEANPNSAETDHFIGYQAAGINRISIGIQSFSTDKLRKLGRVHDSKEAETAANLAKSLNLKSFNLDLIHGLPDQTLDEARFDIEKAIAINPPHISWYQLTIEPNTLFRARPPTLPKDQLLWDIYQQGHKQLITAGYTQYEISAYAKPNYQCQHNLNYWRFGDYLGIGCGAHGKLTQKNGEIIRTIKTRHPQSYMLGKYQKRKYVVTESERPFEFFVNRFRLLEPTPKVEFCSRTFLPLSTIENTIEKAIKQNYLTEDTNYWYLTDHGKRFLNSLLILFL